MKLYLLLLLLATVSLCVSFCTARSVAACNNAELKKIIDASIVGNNLALSSANIRTRLAAISSENFVVICDEKPVTFASPDTVFCQRNVADVFCTVVQITLNPTKSTIHAHPPLSSEAIISTRQEKPTEFESSDVEDTVSVTASQTTTEPLPATLPNATEEPVTDAIFELTPMTPSVPATQNATSEEAANSTTTSTSTSSTTTSPTSTTPLNSESTLNGDSFFEMMIANQEDARRSMMNTAPPPPLQDVDDQDKNTDSDASSTDAEEKSSTASPNE